jgi:transcriptional regulator with GAF, ATPase, and Fis domain
MRYSCLPGLSHSVITLNLPDSKIFGYVVLGPVILVSRNSRSAYLKIAEDLDIEPETFWKAIQEIRVLSFFRLQYITDLIKDTANFILSLPNKDPQAQFTGLLDKFLSVAIYLSGADIGSIMLLGKDNRLSIKASKGLPETVVKNTSVELGKGISGTVANEERPIIIDETQADNRIKKYLNRPEIKSSMIVPIKIEKRVRGVMNLGALENSSLKFNEKNVKIMNDLIDLAAMTVDKSRA